LVTDYSVSAAQAQGGSATLEAVVSKFLSFI
jgi:hypothetical protein